MQMLSKKLLAVMSVFVLLAVGSVAHATFLGTQSGWYPITGNNSVNASGSMIEVGTQRLIRIARIGADNHLWLTGQKADNTWESWYDLGGPIKLAPSVREASNGDQIVIALGNDSALWYRRRPAGTYANVGQGWGAWTSLGGTFRTAPAITARTNGRFFLCGLGTDSRIWGATLSTTAFTGWQRMTMPVSNGSEVLAIYSPAVGSLLLTTLELFMVGTNKRMYHSTWNDTWNGWTVWDDLGGQFSGSPATTGWASDDFVVVGIGTDLAVWRKRFTGSNYLGGPWDKIAGGTLLSGSGLSAISRNNEEYEILGEGQNYGLFYNLIHE